MLNWNGDHIFLTHIYNCVSCFTFNIMHAYWIEMPSFTMQEKNSFIENCLGFSSIMVAKFNKIIFKFSKWSVIISLISSLINNYLGRYFKLINIS